MRMISVSLFILFLFTTVLFQNCGGITVSPTGTNASGNNGGGIATDPCEGLDIGDEISGEVLCGGTFRNNKYMVMPSGCADSTNNPTCPGATDTVVKSWNDGNINWYDIPGITNVETYPEGSVELGDVATALIAAISDPGMGGIHQAASFCADMVYGGYDDWYLPSKSELTYLFCNSNHSSNANAGRPYEQPNCGGDFGLSTTLGGFAPSRYWSSTETTVGVPANPAVSAWHHEFNTGAQLQAQKTYDYLVRCIRKY